ncbi:MAG: translation elongation factor Ts [Fimbriimonadaceae bacterium]
MTINASDVKRLRDETDAPMMECKNALVEAEGDFEKAKLILREKGQAAATKRAGRSTSEGIAKFVTNDDGTVAAGIVLECETDFVAKNDMFVALADKVAKAFLDADPGSDPGAVAFDGSTVAGQIENAVAVIRENIVLKKAMRLAPGKTVAVYNHHNSKVASAVVLDGAASNIRDAGFQAAIQVVAFPPRFVRKEQVPQDVVDAEFQTEVQRALNDGKTQEIAEKMATGRVHKEYMQSLVLLEQPFYLNDKQTVGQFLEQEGKVGGGPITLEEFVRLEVGQE